MTIESWAANHEVVVANDGDELRINCPFCSEEDRKHHLYISIARPMAHCFRCGWSGTHTGLIMQADGCTYVEALAILGDTSLPNINRFDITQKPVQSHTQSKPDGYIGFDNMYGCDSMESAAVWKYLVYKRNLPVDLVMKHMGVVPGSYRAWILVDNGFWQGRTILNAEPKYINPPWPKGDALWNAGALMRRNVIICEGIFSAIAAGNTAIALGGKDITKQQADRIVQHYRAYGRPVELTIMLDSDAYQAAIDVAQKLEQAGYTGKLIVHQLLNGDPTDGLLGMSAEFDWSLKVHSRLSNTTLRTV